MFNNIHLSTLIKYGVSAAILFCIPMMIFVRDSKFTQTWLLYLGNLLFMVSVAAFLLFFNKQKDENASTTSSLITGEAVTIIGVITAVILTLIALIVFVPELFQSGTPTQVLKRAPAQIHTGRTSGLVLMVFMNAVVGNIITGSFISIVLAYYQKKDQTKEGVPLNAGIKV